MHVEDFINQALLCVDYCIVRRFGLEVKCKHPSVNTELLDLSDGINHVSVLRPCLEFALCCVTEIVLKR